MSEIKNYVVVYFAENFRAIRVDSDQIMHISELSYSLIKNPPSKIDKIDVIEWNTASSPEGTLNFSEAIDDSGTNMIRFSNEKYNDWVKPFVDLWQAKKDEQQQEREEAEAEYNRFENRQARALTQLNADFETVKERSHIKSSLGFTVDANQTANENVTGLLVTIGDGTAQFCDYYNQFHEVNKADLETLQNEIIQNAQNLYQQKWVYRTQIENCTNNEGLDAVLEAINFTYMDFSPSDTGDGGQAAEQA